MEIWKEVKDYEGIYEVSNLGRIKSLSRYIFKRDMPFLLKEKILKPYINNFNYSRIHLHNKKSKSFYLHRIVGEAFLPNYENKPQINHIDSNKQNNRIENLEWCTPKENIFHYVNIGNGCKKGISNNNAKLTNKCVLEIRDSTLKQIELAKIYNVSTATISDIINYKLWNHI
jgi:hypothetical protein